MKINKKYLGISTLLSATAMATVLTASAAGPTGDHHQANRSFGNRVSRTETDAEKKVRQSHMAEALANALGTTQDVIIAQLNAGKTPMDIVKASGLDEATIKAQLEASREADMKTRLAADVTAGKITQAQADKMLTGMANHKGSGAHFGHMKNKMAGMVTQGH